jgi:hypothetical protein
MKIIIKSFNKINIFLYSLDIICHFCRRKGHKKWKCPLRPKTNSRRRGNRGGKRGGGDKNVNIYL